MKFRSSIKFRNSSHDALFIVLEPYATEFSLPAGSFCEVVGNSDVSVPEISIESIKSGLVFWGETPDAIYEYWQDGVLVG